MNKFQFQYNKEDKTDFYYQPNKNTQFTPSLPKTFSTLKVHTFTFNLTPFIHSRAINQYWVLQAP